MSRTTPLTSICASAAYDKPVAGTGDYKTPMFSSEAAGFPAGDPPDIEWSLELMPCGYGLPFREVGQNIKSIVAGGGSLEFLLIVPYGPENDNALVPMQLLMMTEHGCEAEAQFWMTDELRIVARLV